MPLPDLNLLRVFLAIWDTRNLTAAGQQLGLTQPAVSHALRRLRESFNDPLFVRVPSGVLPTETATRLHGPLSEALRIIHHAVQDGEVFDPGHAQRVFRIAMSDVSEFCFLPALMGWLAEAAPTVDLKVVPLDPAKVAHTMRAGEVDVTIGFLAALEDDDEIESRHLFTDSFTCLVRSQHPILNGMGTAPDLGSLRYVYANTTAAGHQLVERWLTETGVKRQTALRLGHFMVAPSVVRDTDLAVIFPTSMAHQINADGAFALLPLPPGHPVVDIRVHTHTRFRSDPGIRWLRDSLIALFADARHLASV
ncbi:LysR family transcriptional regulator [Methylobacterium aquaticum]|uniref:LysR family transcriptional regulator n=1 Tax=Methylobacterium aquaticum TaxID=270351 RepID=A0A0J6S7D4_9HYPH|nr:LysR family transcriptional regulator [Methylobacterium aquaticum]KMO29537.1 LysR family transcriptional regulator [Methylobacterium aquaticum]